MNHVHLNKRKIKMNFYIIMIYVIWVGSIWALRTISENEYLNGHSYDDPDAPMMWVFYIMYGFFLGLGWPVVTIVGIWIACTYFVQKRKG